MIPLTTASIPSNSNPILEYHDKMVDGSVIVSRKIRAVYDHLADDILHPHGEWHYDEARGQRVISFIETFCHPSKGKAARQPIQLMLWQRAMIAAMFGFVNSDGIRRFKTCFLCVGRKNGKSTLASAIALYALTKDGESGPEVYSCATRKDQAKVIWSESCNMIHKSPALRKRLKTLVGEIKSPANMGTFKPLSRDSNSLDGLNVSCALLDEVHAWQDENLYNVIRDGMSAREQPTLLITTTSGFVRESVFDMLYADAERIIRGYDDGSYVDERFLPLIYELDSKDELWDEDAWIKANPAIDVVKSRKDLQEKVYAAKADPAKRRNLLCKDFDVIQSSTASFFEMEDLNHDTFDIESLKPDYCVIGVDLSRTTDLTSAAALFQVPGDDHIYVESMSWMPRDTFDEHRKDNVPYQAWLDRGLLRLCDGNVINDDDVIDWMHELREKCDLFVYKVGYDRYSATHFIQRVSREFGEGVLCPVAQGVKTLSNPMEMSKKWLQSKRINYNANPLVDWALLNVQAKSDVNGNIQPAKNRDLNIRIDPYAAMLDALTVWMDNEEAYQARIS